VKNPKNGVRKGAKKVKNWAPKRGPKGEILVPKKKAGYLREKDFGEKEKTCV